MSLTTSQKRIVFGLMIVVIVFIGLFFAFRKSNPKPVNLTIWSVVGEKDSFQPIINRFRSQYPHININYVLKEEATFYQDFINALANNQAPDILFIYNDWLPIYSSYLTYLDLTKQKTINLLYLNQNYPQNIVSGMVSSQKYLRGAPLFVDNLALYYNQDIFNYYNIALPPKNWSEIIELIPKLRKINDKGQLERAAIAFGSIDNIEHLSDILTMLLINYNNPLVESQQKRFTLNDKTAEEAINFYLQFSDPKSALYTYNENFSNSIESFSQGKAAMYLGYFSDQAKIKKYSPSLNYKVSYLPYFSSPESKKNFGRILFGVVNRKTYHYNEAWSFLTFLMQQDTANFYFSLTKNPPARSDLINYYLNDPTSGVFIQQILTTKFFYPFDYQKVDEVFKNLLKEIRYQNYSVRESLERANSRLNFYWQEQ